MSSDFTVHPETRSGDPFAIFGAVEVEECPACYSGVKESGAAVEVIDRVRCRRCQRSSR